MKWSEEFHREEAEPRGAEAPATSLCRAGRHVLCAVAHSHRLAAFEYTSIEKPLRAAGDQRFEEEILHVDALNAATGSLVAISFADETIRLYRSVNENQFALQETFRVVCENVHKLLFAGERLLVAERSEDEEADRVWSCRVVGEQIYGEGHVLLDKKTSVESWCFDHKFNRIYCVDSDTKDILKLKYTI